MSMPPGGPLSEVDLVTQQTRLGAMFCVALAAIVAVGVFLLGPGPSIRPLGLAVGGALGAVAWLAPIAAMAALVRRLPRSHAPSMGALDPALRSGLTTAAFVGLAVAEAPALVALALLVVAPLDAGVLVVAGVVAIASIWFNVAGPGATRRHLERLRD